MFSVWFEIPMKVRIFLIFVQLMAVMFGFGKKSNDVGNLVDILKSGFCSTPKDLENLMNKILQNELIFY